MNHATIGIISYATAGLLLIAPMALAGCETLSSRVLKKEVLEKNAQSNELQKETTVSLSPPPGCPALTTSLPPGKSNITVSYQEPTTDQNGDRLKELAYTTIYLRAPQSASRAIRVWTNNPSGGAFVKIHDVEPPAKEFGLCVTATNWARQESEPALLTHPTP